MSGLSTLTQAQVSVLINSSNVSANVWTYAGRNLSTTEFLTVLEIAQLANINSTMATLNNMTSADISQLINASNISVSVWSQGTRTLTTTEFLTVLEQARLANINSTMSTLSTLTAQQVWEYNNRILN